MYSYAQLEKLMEARGVKPAKVSQETGVAQATLTCWRQGKYEPKTAKIRQIADYFGVSEAYFLDDKPTGEGTVELTPGIREIVQAAEGLSEPQMIIVADLIRAYKSHLF